MIDWTTERLRRAAAFAGNAFRKKSNVDRKRFATADCGEKVAWDSNSAFRSSNRSPASSPSISIADAFAATSKYAYRLFENETLFWKKSCFASSLQKFRKVLW